ncbi:MAG TPA: hypothetical protein VFT22_21425, partial [Kofleriaceae bacterium]|nr:hypothetical protein [Kofleriaceae bacterium]
TLEIDRSLRFADMDEIVAVLSPLVGGAPPWPPAAPRVEAPDAAAPTRAASRASPAPLDELAPTVRQEPAWAQGTGGRRRSWGWAAAALGVAALAGAGIWWRTDRAPAPRGLAAAAPTLALAVSHIRRITFGDGCEEFPEFTRDGRAVIYDGDDGAGNWVLHRLELDEGATPAVIVPQDEPGWDMAASVSPDGGRVAFLHVGRQRTAVIVADLSGKQRPRTLTGGGMFPRWSLDGRAIWARSEHTVGLHDPVTGAVLRALSLPPGMDARWVLGSGNDPVVVQFTTSPAANAYGLALVGPDGQSRWRLPDDLEPGIAMAPGGRHVLASRQSIAGHADLVAVPLDGSPVVSLATPGIAAHDGLAVSPDGKKLAWSTCRAAPVVFAIDASDQLVPALAKENGDVLGFSTIPGSRDLAVVSARTGKPRLWQMDPAGERPPRLIPLGDREPGEVAVSPDGARFVVAIPGAGIGVAALAGGELRMLTDHPGDAAPSFRAAGAAVMFTRRGGDGIARVMVVPATGGTPTAVLDPGTFEAQASPVDDTLVYVPDDRGVPMIADARGRRPLSPALPADRYRDVRISPDGARVTVVRGLQEVIEVDVARGEIVRRITGTQREGFYSPAYGASGPLVIRVRWQGNIYVADAAFSSPAPDAIR